MKLLVNKEIERLIVNEILQRSNINNILSIGYDLRTKAYYNANKEYYEKTILQPGESIFVEWQEYVSLPSNMIAQIQLRKQ